MNNLANLFRIRWKMRTIFKICNQPIFSSYFRSIECGKCKKCKKITCNTNTIECISMNPVVERCTGFVATDSRNKENKQRARANTIHIKKNNRAGEKFRFVFINTHLY